MIFNYDTQAKNKVRATGKKLPKWRCFCKKLPTMDTSVFRCFLARDFLSGIGQPGDEFGIVVALN